MARVDFAEVKARVSIERAIQMLGLDMKANGDQMRGRCPVCTQPSAADDRSLVVTPSKGVFYCFKAKKGGDQLLLAAHVRNESIRDAVQFLSGTVPEKMEKVADKEQGHTFNPHEYAEKLDRKHELVALLGFTEADCERYQMGVSRKGVHAGRFCIPIRERDGKIVAFFSITELKLPKVWRP